MPRTFAVRERDARDDFSMSSSSCQALVAVVMAAYLATRLPPETLWTSHTIISMTVAVVAGLWVFVSSMRSTVKEATVTIYPFGIQLGRNQQRQPPTLLLRDQVMDCIVNEVILAHKVVNVILFRVKDDDAAGAIRLVQAFPGMRPSYRDCLTIRHDITAALLTTRQDEYKTN